MRFQRIPVFAVLAAITLASPFTLGHPLHTIEDVAPTGKTEPREAAQVMSYHGASWLERPEREEEERPDDVIRAMGLKPGMVAADIGCGTGYFARRMAKAVGPEGRVYGVDIQPEFIELLKEHCEKDGVDNVTGILGAVDDPKLPKESLDWIILVDVYHEFADHEAMLAKMYEALKPDGHVALLEYRLLGETAKHIKIDHRMSVRQVLGEWQPAGFVLEDLLEFLPSQHLFVFKKGKRCEDEE